LRVADEAVAVAALGALGLDVMQKPTLLIGCSSSTRKVEHDEHLPRVYTPRRYPA